MISTIRAIRRPTLLLALSIAVGACADDEEASSPMTPDFAIIGGNGGLSAPLSVYTQNLWLGGDTGPLFSLDLSDLSRVIPATATFWAEVQASNIEERVVEIVHELEDRRPAVVALQEAVGYVTGALVPNAEGGLDFVAEAPGPDLLQAIMAEIEARGLPYSVAVMQPTTAIALPIGPPGAAGLPAIAVQDRVVMLKHDDVEPSVTDHGLYEARIPLGPTEFVRGWVRMTIEHDGAPLHFVATHLETQGSGPTDPIRYIHELQGAELQHSVLASLDGTTVLMGDLNSDAAADPSSRTWTPTYGNLIDAGFLDVWATAPHPSREDGVTCCHEGGDPARTPDQRIDFVLVRTAPESGDAGHHRGWFRAEIVGTKEADRTPSGLWPSDHAGIVASMRLPGRMR